MSFNCKYCKKNFTSLGNLTKHQKTTKYCLKIQQEQNCTNLDELTHKCIYCKKEITKYHLERHMEACLLKYQHIIDSIEEKFKNSLENTKKSLNKSYDENQKLKDRIIELETENRLLREQNNRSTTTVEEIAKQPRVNTTTNNHNKIMINTPVNLSQQAIQEAIEQGFSDEYLVQGQKGVARFAVDNILKDEQGRLMYICTDPSRQIFQFKNKDGTIQKDVRATKLTKALLKGEIKSASHKMACDKMKDASAEEFNMYTDHYYEIRDLETDNSNFSKELTSLTT